jgi:tripartite-type tricarboxylate transporter receptor subunit TctC
MTGTGLGNTENGSSPCAGMLRGLCLAVAVAMLAWPIAAFAQAFPTRPMRIVVPYAPGAASDALARLIANGLSAQWPHQVIVDNRPGGNTIIGAEIVARAEPDGHTLLFTADDTFTIVPHLFRKLPIDPMKDLVPVNLSAKVSMIIVANPSAAVDSLPALIAQAREHPGKLSYGSYGSGGSAHLAMETLKSLAKVDILHVPYKGVAPAITAVVAGDVQIAVAGYGTTRGFIDAGRLKPLAIASPERIAQLPNIPTLRELGYGEVDATAWWGLAAPAKTPPDIVDRIHEAVSRAMNSPESRRMIDARGLVLTDIGPRAFAERLAHEYRSRGEAVRRSGVIAD